MTAGRSIGTCLLLLAIAAPALAQTPAASFAQLAAADVIRPRQIVYVTHASGHRIKGRLGEMHPGRLVLIQGSRRIDMAEADVHSIERGDSLHNGLWLGVGAGIATAWIAPHLLCDLPDDECATIVFAAIGLPSIAAGAVTGALVDAAIRKTVFQFAGAREAAQIQVSPVLGRRQAGAVATIRF